MRLPEVIREAGARLEPRARAAAARAARWASAMAPVPTAAAVAPGELRARLVSTPPWLAAVTGGAERPTWLVARADGEPLDAIGAGSVAALGAGVYARVHRREARVALLGALAARVGPSGLVALRARVTVEKTHLAQIAVDLPRHALWAVARAGGASDAPEWGDRIVTRDGRPALEHLFFSAEALLAELDAAGLAPVHADGELVVAARAPRDEVGEPFAREAARALLLVPAVERWRRLASPRDAITEARARGERAIERGSVARARLENAIAWIDAAAPGGPNCYRRTLLETALDRGAAREKIALGLDVGRTGHAWIVAPRPRIAERPRELDVVFEV